MDWNAELAYDVMPKSGPMRAMRTFRDANYALLDDLGASFAISRRWVKPYPMNLTLHAPVEALLKIAWHRTPRAGRRLRPRDRRDHSPAGRPAAAPGGLNPDSRRTR